MRIWIKRLLLLLMLLILLTALLVMQTMYFRPMTVSLLYLRSSLQAAWHSPEVLSRMQLLDKFGLAFYRDKLDDYSSAGRDWRYADAKQDLAYLHSYDLSQLQGQEKLSAQIFDYNKQNDLEGERWRWHNFPVNQMFGVQSGLPNFMSNIHNVNSLSEGRDYVARLNLFHEKLAEVVDDLKKREALGIVPPRFTVEKVLAQMQDFANPDPTKNLLYTSLQEKLAKAPAGKIDAAEQAKLLSDTKNAIEHSVLPGFKLLINYHQQLLPKLTSNDGVWRLPEGDAYYAYQVRSHTTTDMTPQQVHDIGLAEVARIEQQMNEILANQHLPGDSLQEKIHALAKRADQIYPNNDAGRAQILADYQSIINEVDAGLAPIFNIRPKSAVKVQAVPAFAEKTAPGAYYEFPALDGSRPGTFFANLRRVDEISKFGMRTLAYHEAIPGHHFQIALQMQMQDLPLFRRFNNYTAYAEGWALYAERLAWEAGFQAKPLDNLGRLQAEMFRAVRLVVDTGMHYKHWSRERAISYMMENTGMPETEVVAEVERYLVSPGQALAYKVGMLKILQLREKAKQELGKKFDLRQFHDVVLKNGPMPLRILEKSVNDWVAQQKSV